MKRNSVETPFVTGIDRKSGNQVKPDVPDTPGKPKQVVPVELRREIGGPSGPEPTRFGDWEVNGRCSDF